MQAYDKEGKPTTDKRRIVRREFPPGYAHIIGVPFKLFKGGKSVPPPPNDTTRVFALAERNASHEITFPAVEGYRVECPEGGLTHNLDQLDDYALDGSKLPTKTSATSSSRAAGRPKPSKSLTTTPSRRLQMGCAKV